MPEINPPGDGGYNYYHKKLTDLEAELKNEHKRAKQREEANTNALSASYKSNLEKRDQELAQTIQNVRDASNETISENRKNADAEVDRIKAEVYDRWGKFQGSENDARNQQLEDLKNAMDTQHAKDRRDLKEQEENFNRRLDDFQADAGHQREALVQQSRDTANKALSDTYKSQVEDYNRFKDDTKQKYAALTHDNLENVNELKKETERYLQDQKLGYERNKDQLLDNNQEQVRKLGEHFDTQVAKITHDTNENRKAETQALRHQLQGLFDSERNYIHEKGEGAREVIGKYTDEMRHREHAITEDYENQFAKVKASAQEADHYYNHLNDQNLREKDNHFTQAIGKASVESHKKEKELAETFNRDREQLHSRMRRDENDAVLKLETRMNEANQRQGEALTDQAKAYEVTLKRAGESDADTIDRLQKELHIKNTSNDTTLVSPAADAAIRKAVIRDYEKTLNAERDRNQRSVESVLREYQGRVRETLEQKVGQASEEQRSRMVENELERSRLLSEIQGIQSNKEEALRNKDAEIDRIKDTMARNFGTVIERQRQEYEEMLGTQKSNANYKYNELRQDSDLNLKTAQKTFTQNQNELIRDYSKRLADQKMEYEIQISELKNQTQSALRESERKNNQEKDTLNKAFEQRLTQAEFQHKERERLITENYQDQLEKVRRSNALFVAKKS